MLRRRHVLPLLTASAALCAGLLGACATGPSASGLPPVVFVHGNGDSAALWTTTLWRFESAGWPRERLHAIQLPYPLSRDDDSVAQAGRSSTDDHMRFLAAEVAAVLQRTGADKVALVGNSRGGNAIRNYIASGGGDKLVTHAVLGGTPNHGVWSNPAFRPGSEFNGASPFLKGLNTRPDGNEVTPGPKWMTIRSDRNDKFAQPDGIWIGARGQPTNVTFEGPALKGADLNAVLPGRDHREVSFHADAFSLAATFIGSRDERRGAIVPQPRVTLDGQVTGFTAAGPTNLPLVGATLEVYAVDVANGQRRGDALLRKTIGADGRWGPLATDSSTPLEFVLTAPGFATTHIYRSPFLRSSDIVHLRPETLAAADKDAVSVVSMSRPRGYLGLNRDRMSLDGVTALVDVPPGVPGFAVTKRKLAAASDAGRAVAAELNGERIVGRAWPAAENRVVILEMHY
ncbi:MAG: alpha/beta fold hydrolase [Aquabacterium sp.]